MNIDLVKDNGEYRAFIKELFFLQKTEELHAQQWPRTMLNPILDMQYRAQEESYRKNFPFAEPLIIISDNKATGWLLLDTSETFHIVSIIIHPDYRKKGIAKNVIEKIADQAKNSNAKISLIVNKSNDPALSLYRKLGFIETCADELNVIMSTLETI